MKVFVTGATGFVGFAVVQTLLREGHDVVGLDAAQVFKLALEKKARGAYYHAVAEEGVEFRKIAEVIGQCLEVPVVSKSPEEAAAHFTWFAHFASMSVKASSKHTQEKLGWHWSQSGLIADLQSAYFKA